jgi:tetratricopeptide (TPR) repeat protein
MTYKGTRKTLPEIARELDVDALVEGSVSRAGDRVRVRARLARGSTGESLWSDSYERDLRDVLALQSDVSQAIVEKVEARLAPSETAKLAATRQVNPEAYQEYLRGRQAWDAYSVAGFQKAEAHFRRALEIDPTYAPAWAGLADALYGPSSMFTAPNVAMPATRAAAQKALEYDPESVEGHTSLGIVKMVYEWDLAGAERSFDQAIAARPNDANAHWWRGHLLICQRRFDEGLAESQKALELSPLSTWYMASYGWHLRLAGRADEAVRFLRDAIQLHPDEYILHVALGQALEQSRNFAEAVTELERAVEMGENNDTLAQLAHAYGTIGRRVDAERLITRLRERKQTQFVPASSFFQAYSGLHDVDRTLTWIEAALEDHSESLLFLNVDWYYAFVRKEPRFKTVVKRVGLDR